MNYSAPFPASTESDLQFNLYYSTNIYSVLWFWCGWDLPLQTDSSIGSLAKPADLKRSAHNRTKTQLPAAKCFPHKSIMFSEIKTGLKSERSRLILDQRRFSWNKHEARINWRPITRVSIRSSGLVVAGINNWLARPSLWRSGPSPIDTRFYSLKQTDISSLMSDGSVLLLSLRCFSWSIKSLYHVHRCSITAAFSRLLISDQICWRRVCAHKIEQKQSIIKTEAHPGRSDVQMNVPIKQIS